MQRDGNVFGSALGKLKELFLLAILTKRTSVR
jgi:hypothetical protein